MSIESIRSPGLWGVVLVTFLGLSGCNGNGVREEGAVALGAADLTGSVALDLSALSTTADFVAKNADKRVIYIGEQHDRYEHHLNQLAIIQGLHARNKDMAIGLEQFQRPFQGVLDDYVAGRIDTLTMLKQSEWYERWRFDFRLYEPILEFARNNGIPLLALNADKDITRQIGKSGMDSLSAEQRAMIAREIDRSDEAYMERLRGVFRSHPGWQKRDFEQFVDVQLVWDETMAETVADHLQQHPQGQVVVLAGAGHIAHGSGIPNRVSRRLGLPQVTVVQGLDGIPDISAKVADWVFLPERVSLPASGKMGILMQDEPAGVVVQQVVEGSGAEKGGMRKGDVIVRMNGRVVEDTADVRIQLYAKLPGTEVAIRVLREDEAGNGVEQKVQVVLSGLK